MCLEDRLQPSGVTMVLYYVSSVLRGKKCLALAIMPVIFATFIVTWLMWYFQVSSSSMYNPRNFV